MKEAGASAVKFQLFQANNLTTQAAPQADYQIQNIAKADDFSGRRQASESPGVHEKCMTGVNERSQQPRKSICEDYTAKKHSQYDML
ncbi:MAG TPA: N-acetylneuraminate synthase family protein, partial [Candidatus Berkiella sp.]|nr:N-acetylneuraminate synthase family protein [Candidatus Berkiella sp.]